MVIKVQSVVAIVKISDYIHSGSTKYFGRITHFRIQYRRPGSDSLRIDKF